MRVWIISACCVALFGCADAESETESSTQTTGATTTTTTTAMTGSGTSAQTEGTSGSTSTTQSETAGGSEESSSGEACPEGEPAAFTEVEGCGEVLGESFCSEGRGHVEPPADLEYESNPPHSGAHFPTWAAWGEQSPALPRGNWVHNLEHGGIALLYLCPEDCEEELEVYRQVMEQRPDLRFIMTNDPELGEAGFAAVSWTWVYRFETPSLEELLCFADQHENHAPEDVP